MQADSVFSGSRWLYPNS